MAYVRYDIDVNESLYQSFEEIRKKFKGEHLAKADVEELLGDIGFPMKSLRMWKLLRDFELITQHGQARYTYYCFPNELPPYSRFEGLEKEYYNGMSKIKKPKKPKEEEKARIPLSEDFCIDYLKKTGKYIILELRPNVEELKSVLNIHLLLDSSDVKIK